MRSYAETRARQTAGSGDCSIPSQGRSVFPNAASYDYYIPANTGHEWDKHYTQEESFGFIFELARKITIDEVRKREREMRDARARARNYLSLSKHSLHNPQTTQTTCMYGRLEQ